MGLKGSLRKGPESEWQGAVFRPLEKGNLFQRDPKVDPLGIKSGSSWRVRFWPFTCTDVLKRCRPMSAKSILMQPASTAPNLETEEARSHISNFSYFFRSRKIDPSLWQVVPLAQEK